MFAQSLFEIAQLAFGSFNFEVMIFIDDGNAGRIVTAVFELAQSVDNQRHDLFVSNVSDYSTHISKQRAEKEYELLNIIRQLVSSSPLPGRRPLVYSGERLR